MHRNSLFALLLVALAGVEAHAQTETIVRGKDAIRLPEGFHAEIAAGSELTQYPMFMTFDDKGRLFIAEASGKPFWFQLYVIKDRGYMADLLARAKAAGCGALFFTVDLPTPGARYRDVHSGLQGPHARAKRLWQTLTRPRWAWDVGLHGKPHSLGNFLPVIEGKAGLNDYVGWISRSRLPATRAKRLAQMLDELEAGGIYMHMKWRS